MSKQLEAQHPTADISITFTPATWEYRDSIGARYLFATRFASRWFPKFDDAAAAARTSAKTGRPVPEILAEWKAKGKAAGKYGDHIHAYAAARIANELCPVALSEAEERSFRGVDKALDMLSGAFDIYGAELLVFDPAFLLAGYLDVAAINRETGAMAVIDWKTNEELSDNAWGRTALPPIQHVPDSKLHHYALDQSVYGSILESGYLAEGQALELALVHIPPGATEPQWIDVPYLRSEVEACRAVWKESDEWWALAGVTKERPGELAPAGQPADGEAGGGITS